MYLIVIVLIIVIIPNSYYGYVLLYLIHLIGSTLIGKVSGVVVMVEVN